MQESEIERERKSNHGSYIFPTLVLKFELLGNVVPVGLLSTVRSTLDEKVPKHLPRSKDP